VYRGSALIISIEEVFGYKKRYGTKTDKDNLKRLFKKHGFTVTITRDPEDHTKDNLLNKLKACK
jgi:hypothetical protein